MKKLLIACVLGLTATAHADDSVYTVDVQRVITESIMGKAARANVENEVKKGEAKLKSLKSDFESLEKDFQRQSELLSGAALEEKKTTLRRKERDLQIALEDQKEAVGRKNQAEISKVIGEIDKVIQDLGKTGSYGLIMEADPRVVVYRRDSLDLTDKVVKMLDAKS
jgi:Skp family chaperone for outer membrane proteins